MSYPVNKQNVALSNSVLADITVDLVNNVQYAAITFYAPVGNIGSINLSPMQPAASSKEFYAGKQKLTIDKIEFKAAFGATQGKIICKGTATDQDGNDPAEFNFQMLEWK